MAVGFGRLWTSASTCPGPKAVEMLRREIWVDEQGHVSRYNLAYINHLIHPGDNGRVLDSIRAHGQHHRHFMGRVTAVNFETFELIDRRFQKEWTRLAKESS